MFILLDLVVSNYTSVDDTLILKTLLSIRFLTLQFFFQSLCLSPAPPRVTALTFKSMSFTILTCTTTGSPATTVTWRRDGQPVAIDGRTYNMVQTVTNRASATYENELMVRPPALGSTFTCAVSNTLGSSAMSNSVTGMPVAIFIVSIAEIHCMVDVQ